MAFYQVNPSLKALFEDLFCHLLVLLAEATAEDVVTATAHLPNAFYIKQSAVNLLQTFFTLDLGLLLGDDHAGKELVTRFINHTALFAMVRVSISVVGSSDRYKRW